MDESSTAILRECHLPEETLQMLNGFQQQPQQASSPKGMPRHRRADDADVPEVRH